MLSAVTVNTTADVVDAPNLTSIAALIANPGTDGKISLREAIEAANADTTGPSDTITFDSSLNGGQILLTIANGQLNITDSVTVDASALSAGLTIKGQDLTPGSHNDGRGIRLFNITDASSGTAPPKVTLNHLTLTYADPAIVPTAPQGGAIRSEGILTLRNMTITDDGADYGAGVYMAVAGGGSGARTVLDVENSHIDENSAYVDGGGVYVQFSSATSGQDVVLFNGSSLSNNVAGPRAYSSAGGALFVTCDGSDTQHQVIATATHFDSNFADVGGAIYDAPPTYYYSDSRIDLSILQGSTVSGNGANVNGGGVYARFRRCADPRRRLDDFSKL